MRLTVRLVGADVVWPLASAVVLGGWISGYFLWETELDLGYVSYFSLFEPMLMVMLGLPLVAGAAVLLTLRRRAARAIGFVVLGVAALVLSYLASFAFFGGFCLAPGDPCVTTWPSRVVALGVGLGCLAVGFFLRRRLVARRGHQTVPDP